MALRAAPRLRALHSAVLRAPPSPAASPPLALFPPAVEAWGFGLRAAVPRTGQGRKGSRAGEAAVTVGSGGGGLSREWGGVSAEKEREVARGPSLSRGVCPPRPERGGARERAERGDREGLGAGESNGEQRRGEAREGRRQRGARAQAGRAEGGGGGRRVGGEGEFHHWWGRKGKDAWQRGVGEGAIEKMQEAWEKGTWGGEKLGTWARKKLKQGYGWRAKAAVKEWELMEARWMQEDRARLLAEFNVVWDEGRGAHGGGEGGIVGMVGEVDGREEKSVWGGVEGEGSDGSDGAGMAGGEVENGGEGVVGGRERKGGRRRRNEEFVRLMEGGAGESMRDARMQGGDSSDGSRSNDSNSSDTVRERSSESTEGTGGSSRIRERVFRAVEIDRAAFVRQFVVPGLRVPPASCGPLVKQLAAAGCLLDWPRLKNVARVAGDGGDGEGGGDWGDVGNGGQVEGRGVRGGLGVEEKKNGGPNTKGGGRREDEGMAQVKLVGAVALPDGLPWRAPPPLSLPTHDSRHGRQASRILLLREDLLHSPAHMLPPVLQTILGMPSTPAGAHSVEHGPPTMTREDEHEPWHHGTTQGHEGAQHGERQRNHGVSRGEGRRDGVVEGAELVACAVTVGYEYWTAEDILTHVLPPHVPVPTSFESVGHIAHLNLLDVHLPYKYLIAQVREEKERRWGGGRGLGSGVAPRCPGIRTPLMSPPQSYPHVPVLPPSQRTPPFPVNLSLCLPNPPTPLATPFPPSTHPPYKVLLDKHKPRILSVVNKTAAIHAVYRTMKLELLAGSFRLITTARESGLTFKVDFARVSVLACPAPSAPAALLPFCCASVLCSLAPPISVHCCHALFLPCARRGFPSSPHPGRMDSLVTRPCATASSLSLCTGGCAAVSDLCQTTSNLFLPAPMPSLHTPSPLVPCHAPSLECHEQLLELSFGHGASSPRLNLLVSRCCLQDAGTRKGDSRCRGKESGDVFAGVGPIAVAAAKRVKRVYANDLNPSALTFLAQNIIGNRVDGKVEIFNLDGRDFIRHLLSLPRPVHMTRIVMNLPADAIEFLDVLKGAFPLGKWGTRTPPPLIHVYAFSKAAEPELELSQRISAALGGTVTGIDFHRVRLVAPSKWMFCCSFRLPPAVAFDSW
ncbi:unnamed protein product [Closterium sp. NIES-64]|nr:unnamed protein product [Closterium sp. NIES-64]